MSIIAMINARGRSVGVPRKNIKLLQGKPLIAYSIEVAKSVPAIDRIMVSTEDAEIAEVARQWGAEVPFMRPEELATSTSVQLDTIRYNVEQLELRGEKVDIVVLLQPTAPLRSAEDVAGCIDLMLTSDADTVITVTDVGSRHPTGIYRMHEKSVLEPFVTSSAAGFNRQNLERIYWRTGAVYVMRRDVIINQRAIYGSKVLGYPVPEERSFNIDTMFDWRLVEAWLEYSDRQRG